MFCLFVSCLRKTKILATYLSWCALFPFLTQRDSYCTYQDRDPDFMSLLNVVPSLYGFKIFNFFWLTTPRWYDIMTNDMVTFGWTIGVNQKRFFFFFFFFLLLYFTLSLLVLEHGLVNSRVVDRWIVPAWSDFPSFEVPLLSQRRISNGDSVGFFTFWTQKMMVQHINRCVWPWNPIQRRLVLLLYGYVLYHFVALLHAFLQ